jgi:plastocyanin
MKQLRTAILKFGAWMLVTVLASTTVTSVSASSGLPSGGDTQVSTSQKTSTGSRAEVQIDNFNFAPGSIIVKAGTEVTWINHDDIPHTVDSTDGKFKSGALDTDEKFEFRFAQPGEYPFYCRIHPKMTGKIVVQP